MRYRPWALTDGIYEIAKLGVKRGAKGVQPLITQTLPGEACILATGRRGTRVRTYVEINQFTRNDSWLFQIKNGITKYEVGIVADADETFTRDKTPL